VHISKDIYEGESVLLVKGNRKTNIKYCVTSKKLNKGAFMPEFRTL
jgi:hypothetical protein